MILGVGEVENRPIEGEDGALRLVERRHLCGSVLVPEGTGAVDRLDHTVEIGLDDPVVVGVGDEETARGVGGDLPREGQHRFREALFLQLERERGPVDRVAELVDEIGDDRLEDVVHAFPGVIAHDSSTRVDGEDGGPGPGPVGVPHVESCIVDDRMLDSVSEDDLADVLGRRLVLELGRVHADHHQLLGVLGLEALEVGDHVDAVDAAVGPEVEHDDLAPQLCQLQWTIGVQPLEAGRELGSEGAGGRRNRRRRRGGDQRVVRGSGGGLPCRRRHRRRTHRSEVGARGAGGGDQRRGDQKRDTPHVRKLARAPRLLTAVADYETMNFSAASRPSPSAESWGSWSLRS